MKLVRYFRIRSIMVSCVFLYIYVIGIPDPDRGSTLRVSVPTASKDRPISNRVICIRFLGGGAPV